MKTLGTSKTKTARIQIEELGGALDIYRLEVGRYPTTDEGLQALVEQPGEAKNWNGPYLKKSQVPKDPWGFDYQYRSPGEHGSFDVWSLGADNREGGEGEDQDVYGWE
jgi:general secretion pathway protein G